MSDTITYSGIIATYTIATTGTYDITAYGAQGGSLGPDNVGGLGAEIGGDFTLVAGTVLTVVVGGEGSLSGGGGGSFVIETYDTSSTVHDALVIAGGGGGANSAGGNSNGDVGQTLSSGTAGSGTGGGIGGTSGSGGSPGIDGGAYGGGGGGYSGGAGGQGSGTNAMVGAGYTMGHYAGGAAGANGGAGGYGGGGGGSFGGGGGGGYSGGGGGDYRGGGGGGSLDSGLSLVATTGENSGNGSVTIELLCYLRGTHILTPTGEVPVEALRIGDRVVTRFQGIQPIQWIGRQTLPIGARLDDRTIQPVRISAGALADHVPARDLVVSPGHSMLIDGALVLAKRLVNGVTITQDPAADAIESYQIELETHDCVIAEGAWSETYADAEGMRDQFDNAMEFYALYPDHRPPETPLLCASRAEHGTSLEAVLRPIVARAWDGRTPGPLRGWIDRMVGSWQSAGWGKIAGWAQDQAHPELPVLLEVLLDDRVIGSVLACNFRVDLRDAGVGQGQSAFLFAAPVRLRSETLGTLRIRRACDGVEVTRTATFQAALTEAKALCAPERPELRLVA